MKTTAISFVLRITVIKSRGQGLFLRLFTPNFYLLCCYLIFRCPQLPSPRDGHLADGTMVPIWDRHPQSNLCLGDTTGSPETGVELHPHLLQTGGTKTS